jgi:hypothetical protein
VTTRYQIARRSFLQGCGGAAALLAPLLRNIEAQAQAAAAPLRLLIIHHPLGTAPNGVNWVPQNVTAPTTTFTLPMESAPFAPLQSKMVMIDGLNIITASKMAGGNMGGQNTHEGGIVAMMTGVPTLGVHGQQDHCAGGASVDQLLLAQSPLLGGAASSIQTPFGFLALAADIRSDRDEVAPRVLSYRAPQTGVSDPSLARQPIYPETQPLNTFNRIFGGTLPTGTDAQAILARKLSVLDFMRRDLGRLQTLVPADGKDRLAVHTTAIQSLEQSLRQTYGGITMTPVCTKPPMPPNYSTVGETGGGTIGGISSTASNLSGVDYYPASMGCTPSQSLSCNPHQDLAMNQLRLIKTAFACDLVRVATFMYSAGTNWVVFPSTFQGATIAASALGNNGQSSPHHPPSHTTDASTGAWLNQINQFYSTITSQILQEFASQPDVDGNTLLDNTVVVYITEVARAWDHNQQNMPLLVFGGKNTKVKGGTFLPVSGGSLPRQAGGTGNRPFNDFWLSLAPVFGVNWPSLGAQTQYTGPIGGIFAT